MVTPDGKISCLSMWQPWATLWLLTHPDEMVFETRSRNTNVRGPVVIQAAKYRGHEVTDALSDPYFIKALARHDLTPNDLAYGALIGAVWLNSTSRMENMPDPSDRERTFGIWRPERWAYERRPGTTIFEEPIPYPGKQMFFWVPTNILPTIDLRDPEEREEIEW